jgi:hypothetical protein
METGLGNVMPPDFRLLFKAGWHLSFYFQTSDEILTSDLFDSTVIAYPHGTIRHPHSGTLRSP